MPCVLKGRKVFGKEVPNEKISLFLEVLESSGNIFIADLSMEGWRKVLDLELKDYLSFALDLDKGEAEVIALSKEILSCEDIYEPEMLK